MVWASAPSGNPPSEISFRVPVVRIVSRNGHGRNPVESYPTYLTFLGFTRSSRTRRNCRLRLGATLEIPVESARGDLLLRPGLRFVASDASGGAWVLEEDGRIGLRSCGRIDFGIEYRQEDGLVLGFESFYSGLGHNELESYGAGLDLRIVSHRVVEFESGIGTHVPRSPDLIPHHTLGHYLRSAIPSRII